MVSKSETDLIITRGLLEKQQTVLPLERIQAIRISENPLRQLMGFATVFIETAGGNRHDKYSRSMTIIPLVKKIEFPPFLRK
jgi:putative membrane protein